MRKQLLPFLQYSCLDVNLLFLHVHERSAHTSMTSYELNCEAKTLSGDKTNWFNTLKPA